MWWLALIGECATMFAIGLMSVVGTYALLRALQTRQ
jgi:hypothetical protein